MKKRILSLVLALLFTVGIFGAANSAFAMEDGDYRIVFGADRPMNNAARLSACSAFRVKLTKTAS